MAMAYHANPGLSVFTVMQRLALFRVLCLGIASFVCTRSFHTTGCETDSHFAQGMTVDDVLDADIDAKVSRTKGRPIPRGDITLTCAWTFLILQVTLVPVISCQDVLALHQPEAQRKPARTGCYVHETSGFGVDFCGVIALGGAHGLPEGVRKVAVVQGYSGGEQGEDVVGTRVGDENIEVLQFKLSERGPCTYFG